MTFNEFLNEHLPKETFEKERFTYEDMYKLAEAAWEESSANCLETHRRAGEELLGIRVEEQGGE